MARHTGRSRTALSEAAGGDVLPSWDTVVAYVSFCGEDVRKIGPTTFEMVRTDFWPEKDVEILILERQPDPQ